MEKTGLIDNIIQSLDGTWEANKELDASPAMKARNQSIGKTIALLKKVCLTKDIALAFGVEEFLLRQELAVYANSKEQRASVSAAIKQLQKAKQSLTIVHDSKSYQIAAATYSDKKQEAGLPIDSFRDFLKSHNARLTNQMKSQISVPEKNILRQRKEILEMVKNVYMGLQREALGLKTPETGQERGAGLEL